MNISVPDPMTDFVDEQVSTVRYGNASEYIRQRLRESERQTVDEL